MLVTYGMDRSKIRDNWIIGVHLQNSCYNGICVCLSAYICVANIMKYDNMKPTSTAKCHQFLTEISQTTD